jgi:hemolysin III
MRLLKPMQQSQSTKPRLRGYIPQEAFFVALGGCLILMTRSPDSKTLVATMVYSFGLLMLFGFSAFYHRPHWQPKQRALLKRIDHAAIFILIAGTATPVSLFALPENDNRHFLFLIWTAGVLGIVQSIFWIKAPKWLTAILYVAMGWLCFPYMPEFKSALGSISVALLLGGGIVYTVGAVFYALKRPKLFPTVFGYHELFHVFTIIGATMHFIVIYRLIS